jgi:glycerophosphoryl diester phosphodiesterase
VILIAHRMPLTVPGCLELAASGANVFEVDVQLSGTGVVISHALPLLPRLPYLRHDGWEFSWSRALIGLPLTSAVDRLPAAAELLLDLKTDNGPGATHLVDRLLATSSLDPARCYVSSKNWDQLERFSAAGFRTWRSVADRGTLQQLVEAGEHDRSYAITVRHTYLTAASMPQLRPFGQVIAWTVNDPGRALELVRLGVAGVTSDNPAVFAALAAG